MAKLIPLDPTPKQLLCEGWELIAIQAGRYANGTRAVLHLYNGQMQATQQLALAQPKTWAPFIDDLATHTQQTAEVIRQAVLTLADAVELALRRHDMRATPDAQPQTTDALWPTRNPLHRPALPQDRRSATWQPRSCRRAELARATTSAHR